MIAAVEALRLPSAKLTAEQIGAADRAMAAIEIYVRKNMEWRGCDFETSETDGNVIAEVNQRLKVAGYLPQWHPRVEQHKLNTAVTKHVGFRLSLAPTDAAYKEAAAGVLQ